MAMRLRQIKNVEFDELTHSYILGDRFLMGVTSLMKKHGLAPDYGNIPAEILANAAARGTEIHRQLEDYDNGKSVVMDENVKAYAELGLDIHCSEYMVSDERTVASFIDKVLSDCSLADIKTTSTIHKRAVSWQLSIYAYLFELQNPSKKVPHIYCIHVRDGKAKLMELNRIPDEKVKALLEAEAEGRIFEDTEDSPSAGLALSDGELCNLLESLEMIAQYKIAIKAEEERSEALQSKLYDYMVENNLDEMVCDYGKFTRRAESTRTSLDSAKLKKDLPDVYDKYKKVTNVKGSVVFKSTQV